MAYGAFVNKSTASSREVPKPGYRANPKIKPRVLHTISTSCKLAENATGCVRVVDLVRVVICTAYICHFTVEAATATVV